VKTAQPFRNSAAAAGRTDLSRRELQDHLDSWLLDGEVRQLTKSTQTRRREFAGRLLWWADTHELERFGRVECRRFLAYLSTAHERPEGRWASGRREPLKPWTARTHYKWLHAFGEFLVAEGVLDISPLASLAAPVVRQDQVQPFSAEEQERLLAAARRSRHPKRDEAILLLLLDTGLRASELCGLRRSDLDLALSGRKVTVREGKGRKSRVVIVGAGATKALWAYLRAEPREPNDYLFAADRGPRAGEPLTRSGLLQLFRRLGKRAGIEGAHPHRCRHSFAIEFLRSGANVFALAQILGHTNLKMTQRYLALVEADAEAQHRQHSPVDRLLKNRHDRQK
jgi:site-specific recombinase XerD